ncbi:hypothetical protein R1flu_018181 [Riccia fluitans]|uniref:Ribosomal protein S14 n=1 Tax=Riccia fluitans TaxID=41844 RepID=A0ABD1ZF41_9MARC
MVTQPRLCCKAAKVKSKSKGLWKDRSFPQQTEAQCRREEKPAGVRKISSGHVGGVIQRHGNRRICRASRRKGYVRRPVTGLKGNWMG